MKFLCYGDLHATDGDEMSFTHPTQTLQHYRVEKFYSDLRAIYDKYQCNGVIDLGDTTGDRSSIPVPTIEVLGNGLDQIPDSTWNIKLIGNHEQYLRDTSVNVRKLYNHKFNVISDMKVLDFDGWWAFFCSFPATNEALAQQIAKQAIRLRNDGKILFGHFQIAGCQLSTGKALNGVPMDVLKHFELGLLGHIHLPQSLNERIHYVGSPFQQNWGEAGQQKRVAILDTASEPLQITWVALPGYPEYRQVSLAQFKALAKPEEEHRYKVILTSDAETEEYYRHPLCSRHPAVYSYDQVTAPEEKIQQDWSLEGVCQRWTQVLPPTQANIEVDPQELLDIGLAIATQKI